MCDKVSEDSRTHAAGLETIVQKIKRTTYYLRKHWVGRNINYTSIEWVLETHRPIRDFGHQMTEGFNFFET